MTGYIKAFDQREDSTTLTRNPTEQPMIERDETRLLISSDEVDGTAVFNKAGEKLGSIHHFMVGKRDGKVRYAVMSFGGLFGMGEDFYPLPWASLEYDVDKGGYIAAGLTKDCLDQDKAPRFAQNSEPEWTPEYDKTITSYYFRTV